MSRHVLSTYCSILQTGLCSAVSFVLRVQVKYLAGTIVANAFLFPLVHPIAIIVIILTHILYKKVVFLLF
jgi:hypothetical protein